DSGRGRMRPEVRRDRRPRRAPVGRRVDPRGGEPEQDVHGAEDADTREPPGKSDVRQAAQQQAVQQERGGHRHPARRLGPAGRRLTHQRRRRPDVEDGPADREGPGRRLLEAGHGSRYIARSRSGSIRLTLYRTLPSTVGSLSTPASMAAAPTAWRSTMPPSNSRMSACSNPWPRARPIPSPASVTVEASAHASSTSTAPSPADSIGKPSRSTSATSRTPATPASAPSEVLRSGALRAALESGTGFSARVTNPLSAARDGASSPDVAAVGASEGRADRRLSIFRTSSSAANGFRMTSSEPTAAARSSTVPLTTPEMRSTGVRPRVGWLFTYWQIW